MRAQTRVLAPRIRPQSQALARRYVNEPAIAGNDPLAFPVSSGPVEQWHSLAKPLTAAIRAADRRHIVVIETPIGADCQYTSVRDAADLFRMEDPNVLYATDANFSWDYVAQLLPSTGLGDGGSYPDEPRLDWDWGKACVDSSCDLEWEDSTWNSTPFLAKRGGRPYAAPAVQALERAWDARTLVSAGARGPSARSTSRAFIFWWVYTPQPRALASPLVDPRRQRGGDICSTNRTLVPAAPVHNPLQRDLQ